MTGERAREIVEGVLALASGTTDQRGVEALRLILTLFDEEEEKTVTRIVPYVLCLKCAQAVYEGPEKPDP